MRAPAIKFAEARHRSGPPLSGEQSSERIGVTHNAEDRSCDLKVALAISKSLCDLSARFFNSLDVMG
jgi:hypothetical protein